MEEKEACLLLTFFISALALLTFKNPVHVAIVGVVF